MADLVKMVLSEEWLGTERVTSSRVRKRPTGSLNKGHEVMRQQGITKSTKWGFFHVTKAVPARHHYGEIPQNLSRHLTHWRASLEWSIKYIPMHVVWGINMTN